MLGFLKKSSMMPPIFALMCALLPLSAYGRIYEMPLPSDIQGCFDTSYVKGNLSTQIGEKVAWHCIHGTLWSRLKHNKVQLPEAAVKWFSDLIHKSYREAEHNRRVRRQATGRRSRRRLRIRREYRMLSDVERSLFHRALNMLKTDVSIPPNRFDALGRLHELLGERSHDGPNFLGWHRFFLIVAENALREQIPTVTIPYWDSTLDGGLEDPRSSIIWSNAFMGNGNGRLRTGPFTGWSTPYGPLLRNFGDGGTMMNWTSIRDTFTRSRIAEITHPQADPKHNIEDHHGEPHLWVGGHMSPQALAGYDPIFLMHHSFIDLLWELFRRIQRRRGVDPTTDFPLNRTGPAGHGYNDPSGFGNLLNRHSLSDIFTSEMYTYQLPPTCLRNQTTCGSQYIRCDTTGRRPRCVSASVFDTPPSEVFDIDNIVPSGSRRKRNVPNGRKDGMYIHNENHVIAYVKQIETVSDIKCQPENINDHYINNFNIDGITDKSLWSYVPINVIVRQNQYAGTIPKDSKLAATYSKCQDGTKRPYRIFIETNGLNYRGFYKNIVHVQRDIPVTTTLTYLAVATPTKVPSETIVSAYDSCGRICRPFCRSGMERGYKQCSGAFRITTQQPQQFGHNVSSISKMIWNNNLYGLPEIEESQLFIQIFCDGMSEWPWG